jgi:hypothetical protein
MNPSHPQLTTEKDKFMELRRQRLSDLLTPQFELSGLTQREFANHIVSLFPNAQEEGAYIDSLTEGAIHPWLNPSKRAGNPNLDNFWLLHKVLGFTSMDQFLLFLGKGILTLSIVKNEITPEQFKLKVLNMDKKDKIELLKALTKDLLD